MIQKAQILLLASMLFGGSSIAQKKANEVYELDHFACNGKLVLNHRSGEANLKIKGACDYTAALKGKFVKNGNQIKITLAKKYANMWKMEEFIIEEKCFIWDKDYTFCKKE